MTAGQACTAAWQVLGNTVGEMASALELRQPVPRHVVVRWIKRLRSAADTLELCLKDPK